MTHLLSISIGPVQPFIEAARRTADLTAGSELLVDIAKAVARSVQNQGATLIFPADPSKDGPNKILAEVRGDPKAIADKAQAAAQKVLADAWTKALMPDLKPHVNEALAVAQIESFLEFYAAWVPLNGTYTDARKQVELLLAGRKALRDFEQPKSSSGVFKSPLDPARDSVLSGARPKQKQSDPDPHYVMKDPLYLKKAEHLDAVSLIKRALGRQKGHVKSTTQLAAVRLMEVLRQRARSETQTLTTYAKGLPSGVREEDLLYPGRRDDAKNAGELKGDNVAKEKAESALKAAGFGIAPPDWASYYTILCADGDRMGKMLGNIADAQEHQRLSAALSEFAERAKEIVGACEGHLVYSGGDDVLALLPVHTALGCAAQLAQAFKARVAPWASDGCGTLSVGVAIVHHMEPLRISLERARQAEREAKKKRNSLAVALHTRGGEPRIVVEKWRPNFDLTIWNEWTEAFRDKDGLAHGFPYELRHLAREAKGVLSADTLTAEALRILERKQGGTGNQPYLESLKAAIQACDDPDKLEALVAKLIICRFLAQYPNIRRCTDADDTTTGS